MPVGVVKTAEDEKHWAEAKKRAAEQGHAGDWRYIMGIYQRMSGKKSMVKAFIVSPAFRQVRIGGQVPSRENLEALRLANQKPKPYSVARLLAHDQPMLSVGSIVKGMGFNLAQASALEKFLEKAMQARNEVILRKIVLEKCQQERFDGALRLALLQRSLNCWREMRKSLVQVVTPDEILEKTKYRRRWKGPSGKWEYEYDEPKEKPSSSSGAVDFVGSAKQLIAALDKQAVPESAEAKAYRIGFRAYLVAVAGRQPGRHLVQLKDPRGEGAVVARQALIDVAGRAEGVQKRKAIAQVVQEAGAGGPYQEGSKKALTKGEPRGGKYYRRIPSPTGKGYRYIYDPRKYDSRKDAHVDGERASKAYLSSQVMKCILKSGKDGCDVAAFKSLVERFGAKRVSDILQEQVGDGKLSFRKGRFYVSKSGKEES